MSNVFVTSPDSLVTTHDAYRAGVLEIALFKNKESLPYLDRAKALYVTLKKNTTTCSDILKMTELHETILEAAGITTKTKKHLTKEDKSELLSKFVNEILAKSGKKYVDEIVYRYLMALGEQLGGHMRNGIGALARGKLIRQIVAQLKVAGISFRYFIDGDKSWTNESKYKPAIAEEIKAISWKNEGCERTFLNNVNVAGLSKNVDMVLLQRELPRITSAEMKSALAATKDILMMGELKGGIDPAGGDEHWKTARGALERIRKNYKRVDILFICASIEKAMSKEIYSMLQMGDLNCVANLTNDNQLSSACEWIIRL
jgi:hypothetical protein